MQHEVEPFFERSRSFILGPAVRASHGAAAGVGEEHKDVMAFNCKPLGLFVRPVSDQNQAHTHIYGIDYGPNYGLITVFCILEGLADFTDLCCQLQVL